MFTGGWPRRASLSVPEAQNRKGTESGLAWPRTEYEKIIMAVCFFPVFIHINDLEKVWKPKISILLLGFHIEIFCPVLKGKRGQNIKNSQKTFPGCQNAFPRSFSLGFVQFDQQQDCDFKHICI